MRSKVPVLWVLLTLLVAGGAVAQAGTPKAAIPDMRPEIPSLRGIGTPVFEQLDNQTFGAVVCQQYESANAQFNSECADDFKVPANATWSITGFDVIGGFTALDPGAIPAFDVKLWVLADGGGSPGAVLNSYTLTPTIVGDATLVMTLSTPLVLGSGTYWIAVQPDVDFGANENQWAWSVRNPGTAAQGHWRNPGDGFNSGCTDWGSVNQCLLPYLTNADDFLFAVFGTAVGATVGDVTAISGGGLTGSMVFPITQVEAGFTQSIVTGAAAATSYRLISAGSDGLFQTTDCSATAGDDVAITIDGVDYSYPTFTAGLAVNGGTALAAGSYRFIACAAELLDLGGNELNGGVDYVADFAVAADNLTVNPNFDAGVTGWTQAGPAPFVFDGTVDGEGSMFSGSAAMTEPSAAGATYGLSQCVDTTIAGGIWISGLARFDTYFGGDPALTVTVDFFDAAACTGASLGGWLATPVVGSTDGAFVPAQLSSPPVAGAASALVSFEVSAPAAGDSYFHAHLDRLMATDSGVIFVDGFETGDTAVWSAATP